MVCTSGGPLPRELREGHLENVFNTRQSEMQIPFALAGLIGMAELWYLARYAMATGRLSVALKFSEKLLIFSFCVRHEAKSTFCFLRWHSEHEYDTLVRTRFFPFGFSLLSSPLSLRFEAGDKECLSPDAMLAPTRTAMVEVWKRRVSARPFSPLNTMSEPNARLDALRPRLEPPYKDATGLPIRAVHDIVDGVSVYEQSVVSRVGFAPC